MSDSTLEKKLRREINEHRSFIASLPLPRRNEDVVSKAKHQKILGEKELELDLILEKERIESVVLKQEELHPPKMVECPICLETVNINLTTTFICCGTPICNKCVLSVMLNSRMCPLCRGPVDEDNTAERYKKNALRGETWAQYEMGAMYINGTRGFTRNKAEAMRWWQLAADQDDAESLYRLAGIYLHHFGLEDIVEKDKAKGFSLMKQAADRGEARAQAHLADFYLRGGAPNCTKDDSLAVHYATLACSQNIDHRCEEGMAACLLGVAFARPLGGLNKSLHLSKHYLERSAKNDYVWAYHELGKVIDELYKQMYNNCLRIPGHSPIPKLFFYYRKSARAGMDGAKEYVKELEDCISRSCGKCQIRAEEGQKLKSCGKCKSVWYCGRECQLQHWKDGHKVDCIKQERL